MRKLAMCQIRCWLLIKTVVAFAWAIALRISLAFTPLKQKHGGLLDQSQLMFRTLLKCFVCCVQAISAVTFINWNYHMRMVFRISVFLFQLHFKVLCTWVLEAKFSPIHLSTSFNLVHGRPSPIKIFNPYSIIFGLIIYMHIQASQHKLRCHYINIMLYSS